MNDMFEHIGKILVASALVGLCVFGLVQLIKVILRNIK